MRIFGGDRMKYIMTTLKVPEDMPIENKLISKSIESAQIKVEGNNFDIRKHLVEYDDVINKHRESIYKKRREILELAEQTKNDANAENLENPGSSAQDGSASGGEIQNSKPQIPNSLSNIILKYVENEIEQTVSFHTASDMVKDWNLEEIYQVMNTIFPVTEKLKSDLSEFTKGDNYKLDKAKAGSAIIGHLNGLAEKKYGEIKARALEAGVNWPELEKAVLIRSIDTLWIEHLEAMASVRQGIGLRGYGQRDPLVEYKREAYRLYNELNSLIQKEVVYSIFKVGDMHATQAEAIKAPSLLERARQFSAPAKTMQSRSSSFSGLAPTQPSGQSSSSAPASGEGEPAEQVRAKVRDESGHKVGRNDPCPCGAVKADGTPVKYKHCHGK